MTVDLVFVQQDAARATLAELAAELGLTIRLIAQRVTNMEIFSVNVMTVELDADAPVLDAASTWFDRRGIHDFVLRLGRLQRHRHQCFVQADFHPGFRIPAIHTETGRAPRRYCRPYHPPRSVPPSPSHLGQIRAGRRFRGLRDRFSTRTGLTNRTPEQESENSSLQILLSPSQPPALQVGRAN